MESIEQFFERQLAVWLDTRKRYDDLKNIKTRKVGELVLQFNPARMVSTGAKIDKATLEKRPCFLCSVNRPKEQIITDLGEAELLVNPFPILPQHFTIPLKQHEPQNFASLAIYIDKVLDIAPNMMVFYNGPHCGASAPDHAHLQAGTSGLLPLQSLWRKSVEWHTTKHGTEIGLVKEYACPVFVTRSTKPFQMEKFEWLTYDFNLISWIENDEKITLIIPRGKHRPECYEQGVLVSPGALDMGGLVITPREDDFNNIDVCTATGILREVGITMNEAEELIQHI